MTKNQPSPRSNIDIIRGKNMNGFADQQDVNELLEHIDALEDFLDDNQQDDQFGTEGWRHAIGLD